MDKISIRRLEIYAKHGVFPEENQLGQKFLVSAKLYTNTRPAGLTDDLDKSIDYGSVCHFIKYFLEDNTFKLIERAAEQLAQELLTEFNGLEKIQLTIEKPWAPIGLPLETAAVCITRSWQQTAIALGSNLGDRALHMRNAINWLDQRNDCKIKSVSPFIETKPYGVTDQPDFLNGCLVMETLLPPHELLDVLLAIEKAAGRKRTVRWGPRTLDLDILFYGNQVIGDPRLTIPHAQMHKRDFVLQPLLSIAPYWRHPLNQKTVAEMVESLAED